MHVCKHGAGQCVEASLQGTPRRHQASSVQATTEPQPAWTKKQVAHMAYSESDTGTSGWHAPASTGLAPARPRCMY